MKGIMLVMNASPPQATHKKRRYAHVRAQFCCWWRDVALAVRAGNAPRALRVLRWMAAIHPDDPDVQRWLRHLSAQRDPGPDLNGGSAGHVRPGLGSVAGSSLHVCVVAFLVGIALLSSLLLPIHDSRAGWLHNIIAQDSATATPRPTVEIIATPVALLAPPCSEPPQPGEPLAAVVNGQGISLQLYEQAFSQRLADLGAANVGVQSPEGQALESDIQRQVLDQLITDALVQQAAAQAGIAVADEDIDAHLDREVASEEAQAQLRQQLEARGQTWDGYRRVVCQDLLRSSLLERVTREISPTLEMVSARQIVVATQQDAQKVLARLAAGDDFSVIAQDLSVDEATRLNGGDLGWFPAGLGLVPPEIEQAAFAGTPGLVQGPILIDGLYYLVQTVDYQAYRSVDADMQRALRGAGFERWLAKQVAMAEVKIFVEAYELPLESPVPEVAPVTGASLPISPWTTLIIAGLLLVICGAALGLYDQFPAHG